jgi:hypothetical protein
MINTLPTASVIALLQSERDAQETAVRSYDAIENPTMNHVLLQDKAYAKIEMIDQLLNGLEQLIEDTEWAQSMLAQEQVRVGGEFPISPFKVPSPANGWKAR